MRHQGVRTLNAICFGLVGAIALCQQAIAINHSGPIHQNTVWRASQNPHVVTGDVVVNRCVLVIEPGVVVKFHPGTRLVASDGIIKAQGTAQRPIIFTSVKDDSAWGDTNRDGTTTKPTPGDWAGIGFSGKGSSASVLEHCRVLYAGAKTWWDYVERKAGIWFHREASPTVRNCVVSYVDGAGVHCWHSSPTLSGCTISFCSHPVEVWESNPTLSGDNKFTNNGTNEVVRRQRR